MDNLLEKIIYEPFPPEQYYKKEAKKEQIVIHHTVSGEGISGDIAWWLSTSSRIATAFIIDRKGAIHQNFSSKYWAHHLGIKHEVFTEYRLPSAGANVWLNMKSIGIELDSWGGLKESEISKVKSVEHYPDLYRGFEYFETYTAKQIKSLKELLVYLGGVYQIPLTYNDNMWDVSKDALSGKSGVWSHTSFRHDKSDIHPQESIIKMLKTLK